LRRPFPASNPLVSAHGRDDRHAVDLALLVVSGGNGAPAPNAATSAYIVLATRRSLSFVLLRPDTILRLGVSGDRGGRTRIPPC
jgi:hypothetical protein